MLFLCQLFGVNSYTQDLQGFKKVEGLNSNVVYSVMQDSKGYIWVGTEAGASRYDGYGFKHFTKDDGLSDNDIFQIHEDKKGRLWMLTYNGEPTIYDHGKILTPSNTAFLSKIKPGIMARSLVQYGDSIWYVTMHTAYLFVNDVLKKELHVNDIFKNEHNMFMEVLSYDKEPVLITNSGVYYPKTGKSIPINKKYHLILSAQKVLYLDNKLFFAKNNHIALYNLKDSSYSTPVITNARWSLGVFGNKANKQVVLLSENGIYTYDLASGKYQKTQSFEIPYADYYLSDKDGNIWVSSLNQGLFFKQPSALHTLEFNTKLNTKAAYSLGQFEHSIYAGFINGEYIKLNGGKAEMLQSIPSELSKVYGFVQAGQYFFLLTGNTLYDIATKKTYKHLQGSVKALCVNKQYAYIGFSFSVKKVPKQNINPSIRIDPKGDSNTVYNKRVNAMLAVGEDSVFLCGLDGLKLLVKDQLVKQAHQQLTIFNTGISKIIKQKNGPFICSSTGMGIAIFDEKKCWVIDKSKGLVSNVCNSVCIDKNNAVWVATNNGISKVTYTINKGELSSVVKNYTSADGLTSNIVHDILVHHDTIWIATKNGVCFFREDEMKQKYQPPTIVLEGFLVNNKSIDLTQQISLQYTENNIRIDFTGISYSSQNNIQYRYKLAGADTGWNYTTARRIEYSNLSQGKYVFLVSAANSNSEWNDPVQKVEFEIKAPFWKTTIFIIASFTSLLAIFFFVTRFIINNIRVKHAMQQKQLGYEKQLLQLEQQALHLQMNPHFIFNAMNAIKGFYAAANKQAANEYMDKFAGLMRMILEKNAQPTISIQDEITMLKSYLELAALRQDRKFVFDIEIAKGLNIFQLHIPSMLLQPFVENAVVHGIASLVDGGKILVSFSIENELLVCTIEDNGVGRVQSQLLNKYKLHQSKGIYITTQRLQLLSPKAKLTIEDIITVDGKLAGTKVALQLPLVFKNAF